MIPKKHKRAVERVQAVLPATCMWTVHAQDAKPMPKPIRILGSHGVQVIFQVINGSLVVAVEHSAAGRPS